MTKRKAAALVLSSTLACPVVSADTVVIDSALSDSYHFVDTYEILIDESPDKVWPHVVNVASWMHEFSMIHESGPRNAEGAIYRLYDGQNYFMQLAKLIPEEMVLAVNLPSSIGGERLVGIGMITLTETDGQTLVSTFMTRQSVALDAGGTALRERRASSAFQESTRARWNGFLERLKTLAEGTNTGDRRDGQPDE